MTVRLENVRRIGDFTYRWPDGPEQFDDSWEGIVRRNGRENRIRHGLGRREVFGRQRRHSVTFVNGQPRVEGSEADDYPDSRALISLIRKGDKTHYRDTGELPEEYGAFQVVIHRDEIQSPRSASTLAVKIREDDLDAWATHALLREEAITHQSPSYSSPVRRPIHLLLRWNLTENPRTVDLHREVAEAKGSVWWGKLGDPKTRAAISDQNLQVVRAQLQQGTPTYVYLYRSGDAWKTTLVDITKDTSNVEQDLVPGYYSDGPHHLWVQLRDFEHVDPDSVLEDVTLASDPIRGRLAQALRGQASLFLVTEIGSTSDSKDKTIQGHLEQILEGYSRARGEPFTNDHPIWESFRTIMSNLSSSTPVAGRSSLVVKPSSGQGNWAKVPWIAISDRRETQTSRDGVYVVYLFRQDCSGVYLTLNQGVVKPRDELGARAAREMLRDKAASIRERYPELSERFDLDDKIDLRADPGLGASYESSTIAYKLYETGRVPSDTDLLRDVEAMLAVYDRYVSEGGSSVAIPEPDSVAPVTDLAQVATDFSDALKESHVSFGTRHDLIVRSFIASVATKQFVILTGLSGSGKTQLALRFGEWLGDGRYHLEAVRPDWTGAEALFGFEDALQPASEDGRRAWHVPVVLRFMLRAARDVTRPYLLILDEMNLAHVERYFADVLSGMESGYPVLPNLQEEADGQWRLVPDSDERLRFPSNLSVVGTVNVDETTYAFSPKVLDRANVFEFRVSTDDLSSETRRPVSSRPGPEGLIRGFLSIAINPNWHVENPAPELDAFHTSLRTAHRVLSEGNLEFGHRVFVEAIRFASMFHAVGESDWRTALDRQVLQKLLPRLHGSRRRLEPTLRTLGRFCFDLAPSSGEDEFDPLLPGEGDPVLPGSFSKIQRMTSAVRANQFASFAE